METLAIRVHPSTCVMHPLCTRVHPSAETFRTNLQVIVNEYMSHTQVNVVIGNCNGSH